MHSTAANHKLCRQNRFAPYLCPLYVVHTCYLVSLNFCILYRFVFSEGEQQQLIPRSATLSISFTLQGTACPLHPSAKLEPA